MRAYSVISESLFGEEIGEYTSFGLVCIDSGNEILRISDLSPERNDVERFCRLLNLYHIPPDDLTDYLEDFLAKEV